MNIKLTDVGAYVTFRENQEVERTVEIEHPEEWKELVELFPESFASNPMINLDYGTNGRLIGIEIIPAKKEK